MKDKVNDGTVQADSYYDLDFQPGSELENRLFEKLSTETSRLKIRLTSEHEASVSRPVGLTPEMNNWFGTYVNSVRKNALSRIDGDYTGIEISPGVTAYSLKGKIEQIERGKFDKIQNERSQFFTDDKVLINEKKLRNAEQNFNEKKAKNGGEDPNEWTLLIYIGALVAIAIPEGALNYSSMSKAYSDVPIVAIGLTIFVAVAIAIASHVTGMYWKQAKERFGGGVSNTERALNIRNVSLANALFILAMIIVTYARYKLFTDDLLRGQFTDQAGGANYLLIGVSILGNLVAYLVGVYVSIQAPCRVPDLGRDKRILDKLALQRSRAYEKKLQERIRTHVNAAQTEIENQKSLFTSKVRHLADYQKLQPSIDLFEAKDGELSALLQRYKSKLLDNLQNTNSKFLIETVDILQPTETGVIVVAPETFDSMKIGLKVG